MPSRREFLKILGSGAALSSTTWGTRVFADSVGRSDVPIVKASALGLAQNQADVTEALGSVFNSGAILDGEGEQFLISDTLKVGHRFKGLKNVRLVFQGGRIEGLTCLEISNASGFRLEKVALEYRSAPAADETIAMLGKTYGIDIIKCSDFDVIDAQVTGGGVGTSIAIRYSENFRVQRASARDRMYQMAVHPPDDSVQGIWFTESKNFTASDLSVERIGGSAAGTTVYGNGRGVAVSGCTNFSIAELSVRKVGQGIDFSGTNGNGNFTLKNTTIEDTETWGFKFVNSSHDGKILNCTAIRSGTGGFVVTGRGNPKSPLPQNFEFRNCLAEDVSGNYPQMQTSFGYGITKRALDVSYPRNVAFIDCEARATLGRSRMLFGFYNEVDNGLTEGKPNRLVNCKANGYLNAAFHGWDG